MILITKSPFPIPVAHATLAIAFLQPANHIPHKISRAIFLFILDSSVGHAEPLRLQLRPKQLG